MMQSVQSLFDSLKRKPVEPAISTDDWNWCRALLVQLANNEAIDSKQAADVLSRIGKSQAE